LTDDDLSLLNQLTQERRIIALNKTDLPQKLDLESIPSEVGKVIPISALTGEGFESLIEVIFERLAGVSSIERDDLMLTDARQHAAVQSAVEQLCDARELMQQGELEEVVLLRLRGTLAALGEITGETITEDILARIFSTFCIGK
jgi:tRNA modification GTPase